MIDPKFNGQTRFIFFILFNSITTARANSTRPAWTMLRGINRGCKMITLSVEKDKDGFYTSIDHKATEFLGLETYHPDMKWSIIPLELGLAASARASLAKIEATVCNDRKYLSSTGIWKPADELLHIVTHRKPTIEGGFKTVEYWNKVSDLYFGWPLMLNHHLKVLQLPNEKQLTRKDLSVLNLFVLRSPRKKIAKVHYCSVAAIEKRLAKIRSILMSTGPEFKDLSLSQCLTKLNLIPFLLSEFDHFDPIEFVSPHVAHSRSF